jgi:hypothetical protein
MPFLDTSGLRVVEHLSGSKGSFFHSDDDVRRQRVHVGVNDSGALPPRGGDVTKSSPARHELFVDGVTQVVRPGIVAIVPE